MARRYFSAELKIEAVRQVVELRHRGAYDCRSLSARFRHHNLTK